MASIGSNNIFYSGVMCGAGVVSNASFELHEGSCFLPEKSEFTRVVVYSRQPAQHSLRSITSDLGLKPRLACVRGVRSRLSRVANGDVTVSHCQDLEELLAPLESASLDILYFDASVSKKEREHVVSWARVFDPSIKVFINDDPVAAAL